MIALLPKLGDIVTIEAHPYFKDNTDIIISGEHQLTPPLMVVAEILKDNRNQYSEKTGEEESRIGLANCKCIWFSQKTNQFEEAWISSKIIKVIVENVPKIISKEDEARVYYNHINIEQNTKTDFNTKKFKQVVLKTIELELGKKKSSINYDELAVTETQDVKLNINAFMAFVR